MWSEEGAVCLCFLPSLLLLSLCVKPNWVLAFFSSWEEAEGGGKLFPCFSSLSPPAPPTRPASFFPPAAFALALSSPVSTCVRVGRGLSGFTAHTPLSPRPAHTLNGPPLSLSPLPLPHSASFVLRCVLFVHTGFCRGRGGANDDQFFLHRTPFPLPFSHPLSLTHPWAHWETRSDSTAAPASAQTPSPPQRWRPRRRRRRP